MAKNDNFNLEIVTFIFPSVLDDYKKYINKYNVLLKNFQGTKFIHAPFFDINIASYEQIISDHSKSRIYEILDIAAELGAHAITVHLNYNPLIKKVSYTDHFIEKNVNFWTEVLEKKKYENIVIYIENVWEDVVVFEKLFSKVKNKRFKICLDLAHLHVYSRDDYKVWLKKLGARIDYFHISDCNDSDEHYALGDGSMEWKKIFNNPWVKKNKPMICLENKKIEDIKKSLNFLRKNKIIN